LSDVAVAVREGDEQGSDGVVFAGGADIAIGLYPCSDRDNHPCLHLITKEPPAETSPLRQGAMIMPSFYAGMRRRK